MSFKTITLFFCTCILLISFQVFSIDIPFTVEEPNAAARTGEGISCGIAFKQGELQSLNNLSLFEGTTEIPAQFHTLSTYADNSIMWALACFTFDIAKNSTKAFTAKTQAPTASPSQTITVSRSGSVVQIDNGVVRLQIDSANFTGIDSLYYNGTPVIGGKTGGIALDYYFDNNLYENGTVTKAGFVYLGPIRVTFRVEGSFFTASCGGLSYSYMVTTYAGSPKVKINVTIRNSTNPNCSANERINRCYVSFPLAFTPTAETEYRFANSTATFCKPDIKNFAGSNVSMTIHENWGGGYYHYGNTHGNGGPAGNFQLHNIEQTSGHVIADVIVAPDGIPNIKYSNGYAYGPWYWMPDAFHKSSEIFLEFSNTGKTAAELGLKFMENKSRVMGRPDPAYLSSTGAYGLSRYFGTYEDEKTMYAKFGYDTTAGVHTPISRSLDYLVVTPGSEGLHLDLEEDPPELYLTQWIRKAEPGALDRGEAWIKYWKNNFTIHTLGFEYDGFDNTVGEIQNLSSRTRETRSGDPKDAPGRYTAEYESVVDVLVTTGCHFAGQGLIDWYCLTGDIEALECADDLAEVAWLQGWRLKNWSNRADAFQAFTWSDNLIPGGMKDPGRQKGRPFRYLAHYYRVLKQGNARWLNRLTYTAKAFLRGWNRDPRGFMFGLLAQPTGDLFSNWPQRLTDHLTTNQITFDNPYMTTVGTLEGHEITSTRAVYGAKPVNGGADTLKWLLREVGSMFENRWIIPMATYYELTGDEDARDMVIGYAQLCAKTDLTRGRCGYPYTGTVIDFPDINAMATFKDNFATFNAEHDKCINPAWSTTTDAHAAHNGWYGQFYPGLMALGYRYTGDPVILSEAIDVWNRNMKRGYWTTNFSHAQYSVVKYTWIEDPHDDRLSGGLNLFYEAVHRSDTLAPEAVTDLAVVHAADKPGSIYITFTSPAERGGGTLAEYQVKYDTVPIVKYEDFDFANDYIFPSNGVKKVPWWYARNVSGESDPVGAGITSLSIIAGTFSKTDTLYFTVRSKDNSGNLSPMSNVIALDGSMVGVEDGIMDEAAVQLVSYPNPFNPAVTIKINVKCKMKNVKCKIYNTGGRIVKDLSKELKGTTRGVNHAIVWRGDDSFGRPVGSGVYFLRFTNGKTIRQLKLVLAK